MATCKECIHYDLCYHIEHYGRLIETDEPCGGFKNKADFVEVKHGEWKIKVDEYDCEYMMCSVCKEEFYPFDEDTVDTTPNYCMNCGAKMDGGKAE